MKRKRKQSAAESDSEDGDDEDEMPSTKFRRGEALPSDLEFGDDDSCGSDDPPDEIDDGEWNMMGAALERGFLSGSGDWSCCGSPQVRNNTKVLCACLVSCSSSVWNSCS